MVLVWMRRAFEKKSICGGGGGGSGENSVWYA